MTDNYAGPERRQQPPVRVRNFLVSSATNGIALGVAFLILAAVVVSTTTAGQSDRDVINEMREQAIINEIAVLEHQIRQDESHGCIVDFIETIIRERRAVKAGEVDSCRSPHIEIAEVRRNLRDARERLLEGRPSG